MYIFLTILVAIACLLIILVVLVQNPKGGGLSATFGGSPSQLLGVQRTTDFLEKGTWYLAVFILVTSLVMTYVANKSMKGTEEKSRIEEKVGENPVNLPPVQQPAGTQGLPQ